MKKHITKRKVIATVIIAVSLLITLTISIIYKQKINNSLPFFEILYYSSQIVSSAFVISGVVIAVWQYYLSTKTAKIEFEIQQVQRAIDLSEYYKDYILDYYPALKYIFDATQITPIIETARKENMKNFDDDELKSIFSTQQISDLQRIQESDAFFDAAKKATVIYNLKNNESLLTDDSIQSDSAAMVAYISNLTDSLLNNMEYFALHFIHQTADESVVYQSLHQTYLEIVQFLYYNIANRNTSPTHKYYTNVIQLYKIWQEKADQQNKALASHSNSIPFTGTVVGG